jgi:hypothetical protein
MLNYLDNISYIDVLAVTGVVYIAKTYLASKEKRPLPPGPRPLPIIGNTLVYPKEKEWTEFARWGEIYGV